ncbi:hypothetical protein PIB30_098862 [Stylosanthes scabra]|uniref:Uncharacterized protein n=1 Tax=Stylosanthes scabra TaxID=79078 RepID=A0ABU6UVK4_9FABA|nr:hypothetical protein [Stylosanthes scabra]
MNPSQVSSSKGKSTEVTIEPDPKTFGSKSSPTSIEFHPHYDHILLVGTDESHVMILDHLTSEQYFYKYCFFRNSFECCSKFQEFQTPRKMAVKKVTWSPCGSIFGVAFAEHFIHMYKQNVAGYFTFDFLKQIDAHNGAVNDIAFSKCHPLSTMLLITCGDDKKINIWQAESGEYLFSFLQDSPYLLSASNERKIKTWRFYNRAEEFNFDLPFMGDDCKMHFDASSNRFFFSGIFEDKSHVLLEWNESEKNITRCYKEIKSHCPAIISANGILAASDEYQVKFWDMENGELLTSIGANEEFLESPTISFNRKGSLLAVGATYNKIKIFRITGQRTLRGIINYGYDAEISRASQCRSLLLSDTAKYQIVSLIFNQSGNRLFGITSNNLLVTWTWPIGHTNLPGKAITTMEPKVKKLQLNVGRGVHAASLVSYNQYVLCSVGDKMIQKVDMIYSLMDDISVNNVASIATHPKEGIAAFGTGDGDILIYNINDFLQKELLNGSHTRPVTGLAFSERLKFLVSGDNAAKICLWEWDTHEWKKLQDLPFQIPDDTTKDSYNFKTNIGFTRDSMFVFVAHSIHLAIFDCSSFACAAEKALDATIMQTAVSCDGDTLYAILKDNSVRMFDSSTLETFCRIKPSFFRTIPLRLLSSVTPVCIAASPWKPFQFAVGLSDGNVKMLEPLKEEEEAIMT